MVIFSESGSENKNYRIYAFKSSPLLKYCKGNNNLSLTQSNARLLIVNVEIQFTMFSAAECQDLGYTERMMMMMMRCMEL